MPDNNKLGIGIVGCGTISDIQAQAILKSNKTNLISVYSRNLKNAKLVGEKYSVSYSNEWDSFINDEKLDVISICTPNGNHLDYGKLSADAGKHVIVEKPIEITVNRGKQLIEICKKNNVKLAVIFQSRFLDSTIQIKDAIVSEKLGKIFHGSAYIKWFNAAAILKFKNGAFGVIEGSTSVLPAMDRRIEIHGEKGTAILKGDDVSIQIGEDTGKENLTEPKGSGAASPLAGFSIEPHMKQIEAIVQAIQKNEEPVVSGLDSLKSLAIVEAVYKSSKTGLPVKMVDLL